MQKKKSIIASLQKTYCRLKPSKLSGVGVFAIRPIPKGISPFGTIKDKQWTKFNFEELKNLDKAILEMIDDFFVIEKDNSVYIPNDGLNGINVSFFVNNSKRPNLQIKGDGIKTEIGFVTKRPIKAGEELTVAYSTYDHKY